MRSAPKMKPAIGELIMGMTTFGSSPVRHFRTDKSPRGRSDAPRRKAHR